jgi:hypothetical protein
MAITPSANLNSIAAPQQQTTSFKLHRFYRLQQGRMGATIFTRSYGSRS